MEFEFDKEIDALLRQTARSETQFAGNNPQSAIRNSHLNADEISAFAENALPEKVRQSYVLHFADCERCRKILSNVIALNSETIPAEETRAVAVAAPIPWYRKLFAYPNLAYTMGALILVFSSLIAFVVLQNNSRNAEVSQIAEKQPAGKGMSSDGEAAAPETNYSNSSTANLALNTNSATTLSSNTAMTNTSMGTSAASPNSNSVLNKSTISPNQPAKDEAQREDDSAKNKPNAPENSFMLDSVAAEKQERARENKREVETADMARPAPVQAAPPPPKSDQPTALGTSSRMANELKAAAKKKSATSNDETTSVGGRTFKRTNGAWIDSAYRGQTTTNVSRGSSEYRKLDSGVRSIAENLGGTVIIVWKEKAYRIQ